MAEINLLESFPKTERKIENINRTEKNKEIAKRYGREFFDGNRINGYGGYYYDGRWTGVVKKLQELYGIDSHSSVLDIGCAKGFLLYDLQEMILGIKSMGIDISSYALDRAMDGYGKYLLKKSLCTKEISERVEKLAKEKILSCLIKGSADDLPWPDNSFDVVLSINTLHNLPKERCRKSIEEMIRVCKNEKNMFIQVDAYKTPEEKERMEKWILTGETLMSADEWENFFKESGYKGDYFWTIF